jgi:hypothetical protein
MRVGTGFYANGFHPGRLLVFHGRFDVPFFYRPKQLCVGSPVTASGGDYALKLPDLRLLVLNGAAQRLYLRHGLIHHLPAFGVSGFLQLQFIATGAQTGEIAALAIGAFGIPRSRQNPKILWVYDAEVICDRIAEPRPVFGDFFA